MILIFFLIMKQLKPLPCFAGMYPYQNFPPRSPYLLPGPRVSPAGTKENYKGCSVYN